MTVSICVFHQCGDASLGDHTGTQAKKDGGQPAVLPELSHACHTDKSRRPATRRDLPAGETPGVAAVVYDGDVSTGYQLF